MKKIYIFASLFFISVFTNAQWGPVNNGIVNLNSGAKLLGSSDTHLFAGTLADAKMYRTNDYGESWTEIAPPAAGNVPECGYLFEGKYFAGLNSSQQCIFYTTNNGNSWNSVSGGPQTTWVRGFISVPGTLLAFTSSAGIYRSTDGGTTWESANSGLTNLNVIWMETINSRLLAATIGGGVFASTDNGQTWTQSNTGIAGADLNATLVWRMGSGLYYIEQGGASYSSQDEGATWTAWVKPAVMGLAVMEIHRKGNKLYMESRHFAGGLKDSVYLSVNEGLSWDNITDNLSSSDLNASGITEFNGYAFIAYNIISPGMGIYRRDISTGTTEQELAASLHFFPNPFQEKISVSNSSPLRIKQINLFDSRGTRLMSVSGNKDLITNDLPDGIYVLQAVFDDDTTLQRKMIRNGSAR